MTMVALLFLLGFFANKLEPCDHRPSGDVRCRYRQRGTLAAPLSDTPVDAALEDEFILITAPSNEEPYHETFASAETGIMSKTASVSSVPFRVVGTGMNSEGTANVIKSKDQRCMGCKEPYTVIKW